MLAAFNIGFLQVRFVDLIDITLVSFLLFQVYKLMRGSVAVKVFIGLLSLYLLYLVVKAAEMDLLASILGQFLGIGVIGIIILFQPEIRKFLLLLGRTTVFDKDNILKALIRRRSDSDGEWDVTPIIEAAKSMGNNMTGALIVLSKESNLEYYAQSGDYIEGIVSKRLLQAIFDKASPMHDGAVIIHRGKIIAARCVLPVSEKDNIPAQFGLRHRAAIGMTEVTPTLVLVVSEETGQMSVVVNGEIFHNLSAQEIRAKINLYLTGDEGKAGDKKVGKKAKQPAPAESPTTPETAGTAPIKESLEEIARQAIQEVVEPTPEESKPKVRSMLGEDVDAEEEKPVSSPKKEEGGKAEESA
ncbi:hypothetical protein FUAX_03670 [Fulvitalea axinellae]|uniref:Diadenylate cyclase n=1 Tax=Fulvitalea axinellae TaxID=1182444 RepID=A0AAU9D6Z1_9BACT|nr:hypothetical protein FUAX_03670 [Fulvitalea axinellae]